MKEEMEKMQYPKDMVEKCYLAIVNHSWKKIPETLEGVIVRDADKIDFVGIERWKNCMEKNCPFQKILELLPTVRNQILQLQVSKEIFDREIGKLVGFLHTQVFEISKAREWIGKEVFVKVDRPIGSVHPDYPDHVYLVNYGFVPDTMSGDGEELDCYILGEHKPLKEFKGKCIAVIHRLKEDDDKLIVVPEGRNFADSEIRVLTEFQEKYFESVLLRYKGGIKTKYPYRVGVFAKRGIK